jgi:hypothetical protein
MVIRARDVVSGIVRLFVCVVVVRLVGWEEWLVVACRCGRLNILLLRGIMI